MKKNLRIVLGLVLLTAGAATAQEYNISTVAGIGHVQGYFGDGGPATNAQLNFPLRLAVDTKGNFYIADYLTFVIRDVSAGVINTIVGCEDPCTTTTTFGFSGDGGPGTQAEISDVHGLAIDLNGNLYIADTNNARIRILQPSGVINSFAGISDVNGNPLHGYSGDGGLATRAALSQPAGVAVDPSGNIYIADYGNYTVRKVDTKGNITTFAGTGAPGYSGDGGPANKAALAQPYALAVDPAGNIYVSDLGNANIRQITTDGNIHTIASNVSADSIAVDAADSIYFSDSLSNTVVKILSNGTQFAIAGIPGSPGFSGDGGVATSAQLDQPHGVAVDASGNVYVADSGNQVIRLLSPAASSISVVNAAGGNGVSITPGEIVTIFGSGLGPSTPVPAQLGNNGLFGTQLAGTTVSFNGTNGPVIYTSSTQVSAIVPYSTPIGAAANVAVTYQGQTFTTASAIPIAATVPGVFTSNATGIGQAAAVNQDDSLNGPTSPAPVGSIVSLYVTGEGQTTPAGVDGKLASAPLPKPVLGVTATMAGQPALVTYAGGAPGLVAGLMQVNVQVPANLLNPFTGPVAVPVVVFVGVTGSQANVTITVSQ